MAFGLRRAKIYQRQRRTDVQTVVHCAVKVEILFLKLGGIEFVNLKILKIREIRISRSMVLYIGLQYLKHRERFMYGSRSDRSDCSEHTCIYMYKNHNACTPEHQMLNISITAVFDQW